MTDSLRLPRDEFDAVRKVHEALQATEGEPVELIRSPRTLVVQCCYIGNRWTATSPALTGFQVYGATRPEVEQAARDDLADWLDPAVTLEFAERAMTTAEAADFYEDDEPLEKVLAAYERGEKFVTMRPVHVRADFNDIEADGTYITIREHTDRPDALAAGVAVVLADDEGNSMRGTVAGFRAGHEGAELIVIDLEAGSWSSPHPVTVTHDPSVNAAYVYLVPPDDAHSVRTQELDGSVMVDYDAAGNVIGVELLGVAEPHLEGRGHGQASG